MRVAHTLLLVVLAAPAYAGPSDALLSPHVGAAGDLGLNGPFGNAGVEVEVSPLAGFSIAAGGGAGHGLDSDRALGVQARWRWKIGTGAWTMFAGLGYTLSDWQSYPDHPWGESPYTYAQWQRVHYGNFELAFERTYVHYIDLRLFTGFTTPLAMSGYSCDVLRESGDCSTQYKPGAGLIAGLALGFALPI